MTVKDWIKNKIMSFLGLQRLAENPNSERLTYINNDDEIKIQQLKENKIWYIGNGDELLNFYTQEMTTGYFSNAVYNRNKRNGFWAQSSMEADYMRIHSGIPNAIISTLSNAVGYPDIQEPTKKWDRIAKENDFRNKLTQQGRPLTMACGWGGWKINFNKDLSKYPLWEYYDGEYVEYIVKAGLLIGMIFKSFYKDKENKDYVLFETRYRAKGNSYIEYKLCKLNNDNSIEEVPLSTIENLAGLPSEPTVVPGLDRVLAVPARYFFDPQNPKYGRSIYAGKIDLFDALDLTLSQLNQTMKVSTPVEYISPEVIERGAFGSNGMPNIFNRQFVKKEGLPDGDGNVNNDIVTTQPQLYIDQYITSAKHILDNILTGVLSPATMGIDIAKKDNADAQREKEKVTIQTRDNIIENEQNMLTAIVELSLIIQEYLETGNISLIDDYNISIKYNQFANPSFESELGVLGPAWSQGQISTDKYVELLWGDNLSDEEKQAQISWLDENKQKDDFDMGALLGNGNAGEGMVEPGSDEESINPIEE